MSSTGRFLQKRVLGGLAAVTDQFDVTAHCSLPKPKEALLLTTLPRRRVEQLPEMEVSVSRRETGQLGKD